MLRLRLILNLVLRIGEDEVRVEFELAPPVAIAKLTVETPVHRPGHIERRGADAEDERHVVACDELVVALVVEEVDGQRHTVPQVQVDTDVKLLGLFPRHVVVAQITLVVALRAFVVALAERIADAGLIDLTIEIAPAGCHVGTDNTIRRADLQQVNPLEAFLEPRLLADGPAHTQGGEETIAVVSIETVGTVVGCVEVDEIAVLILIAHLQREARELVGHLLASVLRCGALAVVEQHCIHIVGIREDARIVDACQQVEVSPRLIGIATHQVRAGSVNPVGVDVVEVGHRIIVIGGIVASYHLALRLVDRGISQAHTRRQAFGQPVHLPVGTVEQVVVVTARTPIALIGKTCIQRRQRC